MRKYELYAALLEEYQGKYKQQLANLLNTELTTYERTLAATTARMYLGALQDVAGQLELALQNNTYTVDVHMELIG